MESLNILTHDGRTLAARCFAARGVEARRAVVIACALGVPQTFYQRYAQWLAQQGCVVYTFDWRGMGLSAPQRLRGDKAKLIEWATHDAPAVMHLVAQRHPGLPMSWFGHSMGGILYGLMPQLTQVDHVVTLGSGSGYRAHIARPLRYVMGAFWHLVVPLSVARHGYFAGKRIHAVGDLPRGVVAQWRRWCTQPNFVLSEGMHVREAYARVTQPITAVMFTDDTMASREGVRAMHAHYPHAPITHLDLRPQDHGLRSVGHFDFFHSKTGPHGWSLSLPWLGLGSPTPSP